MIKKFLITLCFCAFFPCCYASENETGIPQAVLNYKHFKDGCNIYYVKDWNGYEVYSPVSKHARDGRCCTGSPIFLLYDGKTVRMAKDNEIDNLIMHGKIILFRERPRQ